MLVAAGASSIFVAAVTYDVAELAELAELEPEPEPELELVHDVVPRVVDYWLLRMNCQ